MVNVSRAWRVSRAGVGIVNGSPSRTGFSSNTPYLPAPPPPPPPQPSRSAARAAQCAAQRRRACVRACAHMAKRSVPQACCMSIRIASMTYGLSKLRKTKQQRRRWRRSSGSVCRCLSVSDERTLSLSFVAAAAVSERVAAQSDRSPLGSQHRGVHEFDVVAHRPAVEPPAGAVLPVGQTRHLRHALVIPTGTRKPHGPLCAKAAGCSLVATVAADTGCIIRTGDLRCSHRRIRT